MNNIIFGMEQLLQWFNQKYGSLEVEGHIPLLTCQKKKLHMKILNLVT